MDRACVAEVLGSFDVTEIAHGCARGADTLAGEWAKANDVPVKEYPAEWSLYGRRAGIFRNNDMLDDFRPDVVVAFPGGKGTAHMVETARMAKIPVTMAESDEPTAQERWDQQQVRFEDEW